MVELPKEGIADLCRRHGVTRLELFGSAATGRFGPDSDYDFFVQFDPATPRAEKPYFEFLFALEDLLGRPVDLIERAVVRNRTFLRATDQCGLVIYAS